MITKCKFDKDRDIQAVIPDLSISIEMALTTGVIKDTADSTPYSKMTDTSQVQPYLTDAIDIALEARRVGARMSSINPTSTEVNETA